MKHSNYNKEVRKVKAEYFFTGFLFCMLFITLLRSQILKDESGFLASYLSPDRGRSARSSQGGFYGQKMHEAFFNLEGGQATSARPALYETSILGIADRPVTYGTGRPASLSELYNRDKGGGPPPADTNRPPEFKDWLDSLVDKLILVESAGKMDPPDGDDGRAVGALQIHRCAIDDVNRHYKTNFSYTDRSDFTKAGLIARLYLQMWMEKHREEIAARIFKGGPRGWAKKSTDAYWEKIQGVK